MQFFSSSPFGQSIYISHNHSFLIQMLELGHLYLPRQTDVVGVVGAVHFAGSSSSPPEQSLSPSQTCLKKNTANKY